MQYSMHTWTITIGQWPIGLDYFFQYTLNALWANQTHHYTFSSDVKCIMGLQANDGPLYIFYHLKKTAGEFSSPITLSRSHFYLYVQLRKVIFFIG